MEALIEDLHKRLEKYEECEPLSVLLKGGLPAEAFEKLLNRWMNEEVRKLEEDEMRGEE